MVTRLVAQGLSYAYADGPRAVDGVDIAFESGEFVAVLGPNGAGKSTLLKLLCGLVRPDAGEVRLDGVDAHALRPRERARRISVVPQELARIPEVTVHDFVLGGRYAKLGSWRRGDGADERAVRDALDACDVGDLGGRVLTQLSGGQRQRVLVARAVAQEANVLLVDEPTNSLDPEHQLSVFELLARFTCEGRAVLVVTHDLNLASQFATRLDVLSQGRVAASGSAADVLRPEVLHPVYGPRLRFGAWPTPSGDRPFALPWSR